MNLLFVHDGEKLKRSKDNQLFSSGSYNLEVWKRYFAIADHVVFYTRVDDKIYSENELTYKYNLVPKEIEVVSTYDFKKNPINYVNPFFRNKNKKQLIECIKKSDKVIVRMPCNSGYLAVKYAKKYGKKCLIECVGCVFDTYWNHSLKGKIIAVPSYIKMKKAISMGDAVVYVSKEFLQRRYKNNNSTLSCSDVVLKQISDSDLISRKKKISKKRKDTFVIGTVAGVDLKYKGQQYVIQVLKKLIDKGYNIKYVLVGPGDSKRLHNLAKKNNVEKYVEFRGPLSHDKIFDFMKEIDIYIQPSNAESHGRVIVEALSVACPVVGSSTGGIPELVQPEYVFHRKNKKDLYNVLLKIFNSNLEEIAEDNFIKSKEFSYEKLNKKRKDFYKKWSEQ